MYGFVDVSDIIMSFDKDALSFVGYHVGGILAVEHNMHQLRCFVFFLQVIASSVIEVSMMIDRNSSPF